jgi:hypothetical protein
MLTDAKAFAEKCQSLKVRCDLLIAENEGHGFFNKSQWTRSTAIAADQFLIDLGYLSGAPKLQMADDAKLTKHTIHKK